MPILNKQTYRALKNYLEITYNYLIDYRGDDWQLHGFVESKLSDLFAFVGTTAVLQEAALDRHLMKSNFKMLITSLQLFHLIFQKAFDDIVRRGPDVLSTEQAVLRKQEKRKNELIDSILDIESDYYFRHRERMLTFPVEVAVDLKERYGLSEAQKRELDATLSLSGIQLLLRLGELDPENLLYRSDSNPQMISVMPAATAEILTHTYYTVRKIPLYKSKKIRLHHFIFWLSHEDTVFAMVLNSSAAYRLSSNSTEELQKFTEIVKVSQKEFIAWEQFKLKLSHAKSRLSRGILSQFYQFKETDIFYDYLKIKNQVDRYFFGSHNRVEAAARKYFQSFYGKTTDVTFSPKASGIQLGRIAHIKTEHQEITFHIKTHQYGQNETMENICFCRLDIDIRELLIYKLFEYIGLGPKVHFFGETLEDVSYNRFFGEFSDEPASPFKYELFIATQDVAHTRLDYKHKTFGTFFDVAIDTELLLSFNIKVNQNIKLAILQVLFLKSILGLEDLHPDNFGCVNICEEGQFRIKWKVVDFRLPRGVQIHGAETWQPSFQFFRGEKQRNLYEQLGFEKVDEKWRDSVNQLIEGFENGLPKHHPTRRHMPFLIALEEANKFVTTFAEENIPQKRLYHELLSNVVYGQFKQLSYFSQF